MQVGAWTLRWRKCMIEQRSFCQCHVAERSNDFVSFAVCDGELPVVCCKAVYSMRWAHVYCLNRPRLRICWKTIVHRRKSRSLRRTSAKTTTWRFWSICSAYLHTWQAASCSSTCRRVSGNTSGQYLLTAVEQLRSFFVSRNITTTAYTIVYPSKVLTTLRNWWILNMWTYML